MRVISNAVVLAALLLATNVVAGNDKNQKTPVPTAAPAAAPSTPAMPAAPAPGTPGGAGGGSDAGTPAPSTDPATVKPEDMPTAVRLRRLEQKTQAAKERAWQLKARVQMLKEQTLGGGVGAQAMVTHSSDMGSSFRLVKLVYALDGTQVFARTDDAADSLYKSKSFDIFAGPIAPGTHNLAIVATYRGHGYGVFDYLSKFTFTAKGASSFTAAEGKVTRVECKGYEKGGAATQMEKRAAIECKVTELAPQKAADAPASSTPGATPLPESGK